MRSLKAATSATTTTTTTVRGGGKRKLAQTKEYLHSPPPSPPPPRHAPQQNNAKTLKGRNHVADGDSPPAKRRRSSDRIAQKQQGKKRSSMEDDDGFVFTRAPKQRRKAAVPEEPSASPPPAAHKPFVIDFTADTPNPFKPSRQPKRTPPPTDRITGLKDTFVALPISDTPVIRRNQHLRDQVTGRRRSSLSLRGNRTSSIGNGFEALPHPDVAFGDFHKHIKADLPEPVRMKQLLAWCLRRALDEQKAKYASTESSNAAAIARVIEEEVTRDLIDNKISTSWYHRQDSSDGVPVTTVKKRPHPQNLENLRKIQQCEERLSRLKKEQESWNQLFKSTEDKLARSRITSSDDTIDPTLVRPIEASFLRTLDAQHAEQDNALRDIKTYTESGELEFQVDKLYQTLHTVTQFTEIADKFGSKVLEEAERVLSERDKRVERAAGTDGRDVQMLLRQITRV